MIERKVGEIFTVNFPLNNDTVELITTENEECEGCLFASNIVDTDVCTLTDIQQEVTGLCHKYTRDDSKSVSFNINTK